MIGTSTEILSWFASDSRYANLLDMSRQRLVWFRMKLKENHGLSEERKEEYLKKIQDNLNSVRIGTSGRYSSRYSSRYSRGYSGEVYTLTCLRKRYILPAVVCDHHGRLFHENTLIKMCYRKKEFADLNLANICNALGREGRLPKEDVVRELLRRKGWNMVEPRHVLPSVWKIE